VDNPLISAEKMRFTVDNSRSFGEKPVYKLPITVEKRAEVEGLRGLHPERSDQAKLWITTLKLWINPLFCGQMFRFEERVPLQVLIFQANRGIVVNI
jgi:hypothetical protein